MTLDVVLPTLNRARLLGRALRSLLSAPVPRGLDVLITVVNNNSTDETAELLEHFERRHSGRLQVLFEPCRGKSRALNAAIAATQGDLVGMIDDDEEIDPRWFGTIARAFADPSVEYIGGPYVLDWEVPPPDWLPQEYWAVLGAVDNGSEAQDYGPDFPGILKGGNAVVRRGLLQRVGPYAEHLGPTSSARLLSCEDEEMYLRLLRTGARGRYLPSLLIRHTVSAERLTPEYYRRWCFWRGVSRGLMGRTHRLDVPHVAGVPRFLYGRAVRGALRMAGRLARGRRWRASFNDELALWDLTGYLWGRHIYTPARTPPLTRRRVVGAHADVSP